MRYTFPVLLTPDRDFAERNFKVLGAPTSFLLTAESKTVFRHFGYQPGDEKTLETEIRELLGLDRN